MWEVRGLVHWWSLGRDSVARVSRWCSALAEVKVMVDMPSSGAASMILSLNLWMSDVVSSWADFCMIGAVRNGVGMSDPLACTSFPRVSGAGPGMAGGQGRWRSSCSWGRRTVADDVVPQGFPADLPWPVRGQVQRRLAGGRGEAGGHVDQVAAQGGTAR